jgi:hypothetical protein
MVSFTHRCLARLQFLPKKTFKPWYGILNYVLAEMASEMLKNIEKLTVISQGVNLEAEI